jgi:hypothetical protein
MAPKDRVPLVSAGLAVASLLLLLLCATRCGKYVLHCTHNLTLISLTRTNQQRIIRMQLSMPMRIRSSSSQ